MTKRILSIDGGGIKGTLPVSFLASIERHLGGTIAEYFDLIAGTSTGGIIAIGLGLGLSAQEILKFYEDLGPKIFATSGGFVSRSIKRIFCDAKYSSEPLKQALKDHFGDKKLGNSHNRLVIPTFNFDTGKTYIYKTAHHERFREDYLMAGVDVALATTAAPLYFMTHRNDQGIPMVDGGIWCNNPTMVAVLEGTEVLGWSPEEIRVLSIGCTGTPVTWKRACLTPRSILHWFSKELLLDVVMKAQSEAAHNMAVLRLGNVSERVWRVNPIVAQGIYSLDGVDAIESLKGVGYALAREEFPLIKKTFFSEKADRFMPIYQLQEADLNQQY